MNEVIYNQPVTKFDLIVRIIAVGGVILLFIIIKIIEIIDKYR